MGRSRSLCRQGTRYLSSASIRGLSMLLAASTLAACAAEAGEGAEPGASPPADAPFADDRRERRTSADLIEPTISPEIEITAPVVGPGFGHHVYGVASDGAQRLVLWRVFQGSGNDMLRGTRVAQDGTVLDPFGIDVVEGGGYPVGVTFDGSNYLIATGVFAGSGVEVRAGRVSPGGVALDPGGILVATAAGNALVQAASNGAGSLVAWSDGSGEIRRARVASDGAVLDPGGVATATSPSADFGLTSHGAGFLVTWLDPAGVLRGARVSANGDLLDPGGFVIEAPVSPEDAVWGFSIRAGSDGAHTWVTWLSNGNSIKARRVAIDGTLPDAAPIVVYTAASQEIIRPERVASLGTNVAVMWTRETGPVVDASPLVLTRISPAGVVLDPSGIPFTADGSGVYLAPDSAGAFVAWGDDRREPFGYVDTFIAGARLGADGALVDAQPTAITSRGSGQLWPRAAFDGQSYFMAWADLRVEGGVVQRDVYGARVTPDGEVLDTQGVAIATGQGLHGNPQVVSGGAGSFVLWREMLNDYPSYPEAIRGARVSQDGVVLDATPLEIPVPYGWPSLTFYAGADPGGALVIGGDEADGLAAVRVGNDGSVSSPVTLAPAPFYGDLAISFDGSGYFLLWEEFYDEYTTNTLGIHLDVDGTPLDAAWIPIFQGHGIDASAFGGGQHLVLWEERAELPSGSFRVSLRAARITAAGEVLDPQGILVDEHVGCYADGNEVYEAVTYEGSAFLLTWTMPTAACTAGSAERRLAYLDAAGVLGPVFTPEEGLGTDALASGGGTTLFAYPRYVAEAPYQNARVFARIVQQPAPPPPCPGGEGCEPEEPQEPEPPEEPQEPQEPQEPEPCTGACGDPADPTEEPPPPGSCSVTSSPATSSSLAALALAGLAAALRRRRRPQA